ncbi:Calcium-transporting ATPase 12, plasma membrane-type [Camellia lanceoleosa]|uniref:Calcium-transporting ATPase 12, plasma membrane-type n=1 Tax=Camellia lanceoleosa TaxID=1840588 RepID=A0ACC0HIB7_9ERIC|nr:Calcium-transporting ATPase 12, plasma membrane-type [Camellia lanceoleosa]
MELNMDMEKLKQSCSIIYVEAFNSTKKRRGVSMRKKDDNTINVHWKGATEMVLAMCSHYYDVSGEIKLFLRLDQIGSDHTLEHREFIKRSHRRLRDYDVDRRHNDEFSKWFNSHILSMSSSSDYSSSESERSSSSSSSSDETQATLKMRVIPDPPASWHPPGSLSTTSRSGSFSWYV